ncbi:hypothetical protein [Gracilibacillus sp. YIM 98692]|uniref:hypothetical protein n=1 Tax=Gracilibacillus sp. YIM 98692 TaxID=2663532 RepID=UPI0013D53D6B|nr:hypothetical protein [Gracilibacillus sp. YIM 98692]
MDIRQKVILWGIIIILFILVIYQAQNRASDNQNYEEQMVQMDDLKKENQELKKVLEELTDENNSLKSEVPSDFEGNFVVDGVLKKFEDKEQPIKYLDNIYVPLSFVNTGFGKSVKQEGQAEETRWIKIGNTSVISEGFRPINQQVIHSNSPLSEINTVLGQPLTKKTYENEVTGIEETEAKYKGVEVITGRNITVNEPVLETNRGITISSTKEQVRAKYGEPYSENSSNDRWSYGDYKANLWFEFENNMVVSFGIYHIDS